MSRRAASSTLLALGLLSTGACDENASGHWCGSKVEKDEQCTGDEVGFLLLQQSGEQITGQVCEAYEQDCYVIEDGVIDGALIAFRYTFADVEVVAKLEVAGERMSGLMHSSKCDCDIGFNFHRID